MDEIGLSTKDFVDKSGKMKSMTDIFQLLNTHMKDLGGHDRTDVFHAIFGQTGQQAGGILVQNADALGKLDEKVKKSVQNDYVHKLAQKNMNTAKQQIKRFKAAGEAVAEIFARKMLPVLTEFTKKFSGVLDYIGKMPKGFQDIVVGVGLAIPALVLVGGTIGVVAKSIAAVKRAQVGLMQLFSPFKFKAVETSISDEALAYEKETAVIAAQNNVLKENNALKSGGSIPASTSVGESGGIPTVGGGTSVGSRTTKNSATVKKAEALEAAQKQGGVKGWAKGWGVRAKSSISSGGAVSKLIDGAALVTTATDFGKNAFTVFNKGVKSQSGKQGAWGIAGQVVGGGIGAIIGGPAGLAIGSTIGDAAAKKISKSKIGVAVDKAIGKETSNKTKTRASSLYATANTSDPAGNMQLQKDYDKREAQIKKHAKNSGAAYYKEIKDASDKVHGMLDKSTTNYDSKLASEVRKSGTHTDSINSTTYKKMSEYLKKYATQAKKGSDDNIKMLEKSGYLTKAQAKAASKSAQNTLKDRIKNTKSVFSQMKSIEKEGDKEMQFENKTHSQKMAKIHSSYTKSMSSAEKEKNNALKQLNKKGYTMINGIIYKGEDARKEIMDRYNKKAKKAEKDRTRATDKEAKRSSKSKESIEKNAGLARMKAMAKANSKIDSILTGNAAKQKGILKKLRDSSGKISDQQAAKMIKASYKTEKETIKHANSTYKKAKGAADKKYKATVKAANEEYYLHGTISKKQHDDILSQADSTKKNAIQAAKDQKKETTKQAEKQHTQIVKEAKQQAKGHLKYINQETGDAQGAFEKFGTWLSGFGKGLRSWWDKLPVHWNIDPSKGTVKDNRKGSGKKTGSHAQGGAIKVNQLSMVGENGVEVLQRGKTFQLIGQRGAQLMNLRSGDRIYNNADTRRMMNGSYNQRLQGFASGTTSLVDFPTGGVGSKTTSKEMAKDVKKNYQKMEKGTKDSLNSISKQNKKSWSLTSSDTTSYLKKIQKNNKDYWNKTSSDTSKKTSDIHKTAKKNSDSTEKDYINNIKSLNKQNSKLWSDMASDSKDSGNKIYKEANKRSSDTKDKVVSNWKSLSKQFKTISNDMESGFDKAFKQIGPDAKSSMKTAVNNMNSGITAVNTTLSQFGGNKKVLSPIHYAVGSRGPISSDQLAVLNDATGGPRQELVVRNGELLKPHGNDVLTPLKKGDEVLNGHQAKKILDTLPHYAGGTGVSNDALIKMAEKYAGDSNKAWKELFLDKYGKEGKTTLAKGLTKTTKGAVQSVGPAWSAAMWNLINNTVQGGGNGSLKPHFGSPFSESSGYGPRSGDVSDNHKGIDFSAPMGTPIPAQYAGTVVTAGHASGFGNWVVIRPDGMNMNTIYGHMKSYRVHEGEHVKAGQIIANVGAEGEATGPHVHYELRQGLGAGDYRPNPDTYKGKVRTTKGGSSKLNSLVKQELGSKAIKWIEDHLSPMITDFSMGGSVNSRAQSLAKAIKRAFPSATNNGIAAVLGNWSFESGLNPSAQNSSGGASGLGQWLGGRKSNLMAFARSKGKSWTDPSIQLDFALNHDGSDSSYLRKILRGSGSVASLAASFSNNWERGGYTAEHVAGARRIAGAIGGYENGGLSTKHKLTQISEGNKPEMVIPLTKTARSYELIGKSLALLNNGNISDKLSRSDGFKLLSQVLDKLNISSIGTADSSTTTSNLSEGFKNVEDQLSQMVQLMQLVISGMDNPTPAFIAGGDQTIYDSYNRQKKIKEIRGLALKGAIN